MSINVELTKPEFYLAANVGIQRQCSNVLGNKHDRFGCDAEDGWATHIEGACSEMAVAKYFGLYWSGAVGNFKADDVGRYQVRSATEHNYCLIIHPTDLDDRPFILVTGSAPKHVLRGWLLARDGKRQEFWKDPTRRNRYAFFVPQSELKPMVDLIKRSMDG